MATLRPWDPIVNILSRLDVKYLLRYRCLSKPWCSLIDSPHFIKMHLKHAMETDSNLTLIRGNRELHLVDLDGPGSTVQLNPPISNTSHGIVILGHSNGLIALQHSGLDMGIWNPSTRKFRKVLTLFPGPEYKIGVVRFGYDPVNDDHKLLCNVHCFREGVYSFQSEVKVFSVKTKTWKRVGDFPHEGYIRGNGLLARNSLHWMVRLGQRFQSNTSTPVVVAFDLVTEEYCEILLPNKENETCNSFYTTLSELGGWLSVVSSYWKDKLVDHVDIWVMKEYGVKESWTKLFSMVPSDVTIAFDYVMPLAYLKSAHQVLLDQDNKKLLLFDLRRKKAESVRKIPGNSRLFDMFVYVRSLLAVGEDDEDNNEEEGKGE